MSIWIDIIYTHDHVIWVFVATITFLISALILIHIDFDLFYCTGNSLPKHGYGIAGRNSRVAISHGSGICDLEGVPAEISGASSRWEKLLTMYS